MRRRWRAWKLRRYWRKHRTGYPPRAVSEAMGCTCQWWGDRHIAIIERNCPVEDLHRPRQIAFTRPSR